MIEIVLIGVILLLCGLLGWNQREGRLERNKLVNALLAKNAQELRDLEFVEKVAPSKPMDTTGNSDFIPESELDDETLLKMVKEGNG